MNRNKKTLYLWVLIAAPVILPQYFVFHFFIFCGFCERGDSWYTEGKFWFSFTLKVSFGFPSIFGFEKNWEEDFLTLVADQGLRFSFFSLLFCLISHNGSVGAGSGISFLSCLCENGKITTFTLCTLF